MFITEDVKGFAIKYGKFNFLIFQMDPLYLIFTTIWLNSQLRSSIIFPVSLLFLLALYEGVVKLSRPRTFVLDINLPGVFSPLSPCHGHVGGPRPQCSKVFMKIRLGAVRAGSLDQPR